MFILQLDTKMSIGSNSKTSPSNSINSSLPYIVQLIYCLEVGMLTAVKSKGNKIMPTVTVLLDRVALLHLEFHIMNHVMFIITPLILLWTQPFFASPNSIKVLS